MITCPRCGADNADSGRFCSNCGNALTEATAPAQIAEMRKTVTVMFMDAVGSTSAGERTDPETLRRVMTRYFDEIRAVVERHGGSVEKYIGDAVMAVFGVPVVHEDDALRAVRAAIEIRGRVATLSAELRAERGVSVEWRTGINSGEVVAGDAGAGQRFVSGDAVNVAARLEQAAQPGEVLIGAETFPLVRDSAVLEPAPPILVKGKAEPLETYRLVEVAPPATQARRLDSPMVGRRRQRRVLTEAFQEIVDDRVCHLFTILGAAGVGKSRLVAEFLADIANEAQILHGRCLSYGEGITYWPITQAVREAAGLAEDDTDEQVRQKIAALVDDGGDRAQVTERIGALLGRFPSVGVAEETFWAVRTLLESLGRRRPLVLVLDDIHWAEPTLLDLIEHIADWTQDAPLLVLCVARQELLENRPGWGGGKGHATTLTLEPLNDNESQELMLNLLGEVELGTELMDKISRAAEGNPLFVEEMIGMLIDNGDLVRRDGGWAATASLSDVTVPPSIQALLAARLDRLPVPERAVIERGAVEGKVFHRNAVAELAPDDLRGAVPGHLMALSRKELVRPDRSDFAGDEAFRFRHLLIRDAAYGAMPKGARADLHARFADWLERVAGDRVTEYEEILGYHLEQAYRYRVELGPPDDEARRLATEAARRLGASGQRALLRGDVAAATKLVESAIELLPEDDHARYRLIADLGYALSLAGELRAMDNVLAGAIRQASAASDTLGQAQVEVARLTTLSTLGQINVQEVVKRSAELLAIFEQHGDDWGIDHATWELARHLFFAGRAQVADDLIATRIARLVASEQPVPMMFHGLSYAVMFWGPTPVQQALGKLKLLDVSSSKAFEALLLRPLGGFHGLIGEFETGRQLLRRSIEIEMELGRHALATSAAGHFLGPLEHLAGNYEEAETILRTAYERMSGTGDLAFSSSTASNLAAVCIDRGHFDHAEEYARIAVETSTADDVSAQSSGRSVAARVLTQREQHGSALALAREAVQIAEGTDYLTLRGEALARLAEVELAAGEAAAARDSLQRSIENFHAKGATFLEEQTARRMAEITPRGEG